MQTIGSTQAPGCVVCHSLESEVVKVGPSHAGIAARASTILQSPDYGGEAKTVEGYIRESILSPDVYVAEGFPSGLMYQDYGELLSEQDLADLVAFIMENQ